MFGFTRPSDPTIVNGYGSGSMYSANLPYPGLSMEERVEIG